MKYMPVFISLLALTACSAAADGGGAYTGGAFTDAVSSASYGLNGVNKPALSFYKSTKQVSVGGTKGLRPPDAVTAATFTYQSAPAEGKAIYKNGANSFIGFIAEGRSIKKTAPASSAAAVDFNTIEGTYTR